MTQYNKLCEELNSLTKGVSHLTANLANASSLIYNSLDRLNWAGFYLLEGDRLVLNAFQGRPACIEIPMGRGICGSAVAQNKTLVVQNVHKFEGHIACDSASMSEIVIPLTVNNRIFGVLDIDSPIENRFSETDRQGLEKLAIILTKNIERYCK